MTRFREKYDICHDTRECCFAVIHGGLRLCKALRETYETDGTCEFCKANINDRTDKKEEEAHEGNR